MGDIGSALLVMDAWMPLVGGLPSRRHPSLERPPCAIIGSSVNMGHFNGREGLCPRWESTACRVLYATRVSPADATSRYFSTEYLQKRALSTGADLHEYVIDIFISETVVNQLYSDTVLVMHYDSIIRLTWHVCVQSRCRG